jgi:tetratricopeptide (TPR) repeat protein
MTTRDTGAGDEDSRPAHRSELSGSAADVVQARDVHGGVHFHGGVVPAPPVPRQLPGDIVGFVDRVIELRHLDRVLPHDENESFPSGVYVITGTAGVGKTSLALHWAHRARRHFPHGQLYVNLRGYDPGPPVTPEQTLDRFLRALGMRKESIPTELEDMAASYRSLLADRRLLVVLDNAASVRQVRPLLPGSAGCLVLVTSRSRLSGLVARDGARRLVLGTLSEDDAAELLRRITAGYRSHDDPAELAELARLCARLPLALRIAAERASSRPLMMLGELIADLRDESALWDALTAEDGEEADAVRSVFAWSYRALPEDAARLFRLLGLHPGPEFSVEAAAALSAIPLGRARSLLDVLVGAHMLEQRAPGRYEFHDLLRAYAGDQAGEHETPESRHDLIARIVTWYLHCADAAVAAVAPLNRRLTLTQVGPDLAPLHFTDPGEAFRWYEQERTNLVAATGAAARTGLHTLAWQIPATLKTIHARQNAFTEWLPTAHLGLDSARAAGDRFGEAEILDSLGKAFLQSQRFQQAEEYHSRCLALRREIGDTTGEGVSVNALGLVHWRRRNLLMAESRFKDALWLFRRLGSLRWEAVSRANLGMVVGQLGRGGEAVNLLRGAAAVFHELGDRAYEGDALHGLATNQREMGQINQARTSIERALALAREDNLVAWEAFWLLELARIQRAEGNPADALTSCQRAAVIQRTLGDRGREAMALDGTGEAYRELGNPDEGQKFHRLAAVTFRELGDRWHLALALANLAECVAEIDGIAEAQAYCRDALENLDGFDDPEATEVRQRMRAMAETA